MLVILDKSRNNTATFEFMMFCYLAYWARLHLMCAVVDAKQKLAFTPTPAQNGMDF
jgi:hypothetical protein